ncbi:hypothetical protein D0862_09763 [Hortaea werneckii]|uniref:Phosphatidic acid phosphatase type 2/haloperoxidase domain-containing protein n=2 Tax=Hortaea werneckii TaxID=91943 RepID=A0A3M7FSD4_HORWE|nr:hypothetical protein D0862_09763 [Hortaea werneckii]
MNSMVSYPPHPVTSSNDVASTNVSGAENENQSRKPGQTDAERDQPIVNTERPSFGQWLKAAWPDLLTMIIVGAVGLGAYWAPPAPSRSFPIHYQDGTIVFPEFAYPLRREVVPIWAATLLATLAPIAVILIMQIRIRSFWDAHNAIVGLLYSLITAAVFQVFLKWLIGGLRPHFLAVCKPKIPKNSKPSGNGFDGVMYNRSVCTGDKNEIDDSLESFPSGHTTAAFAGFVYLYLYLNAKLKVWSNHHPAYWKLIVTYIPILGAVLIGGALTIDEFHNWYDIIAGAVIGTVMAVSAFRMVYAGIWDFRYNHIPLMRHRPIAYDGDTSALNCLHDLVWTRDAGWGTKTSRV